MDYGLIPCLVVDGTTDVDLFIGYWILAIYEVACNRIRVFDGFGNVDILERFPVLRSILVGASRLLSHSHNMAQQMPCIEMAAIDSYNCAMDFSQMPFAIAMLAELFAHGSYDLMLQPDLDIESYTLRVLKAYRALDDGLDFRTPQLAQLRRHIQSHKSEQPSAVEVPADEDVLTETDAPSRMPRRSVGLMS